MSTLSFSAFVMSTPSHITHGLWKQEDGHQMDFNDIDLWVNLAKDLEAGGFDSMFFADVIGLYGDYEGGWDFHVKNGLQIPSNDPMMLMSALAVNTKHLGLAFTAGPHQEPPFNFARRVSTLDHISKGRIAWNIVTGSLENGFNNLGVNGMVPHDKRYEIADEYVDVLYKLWEGSWDEEALLKDRTSGVYANPEHVHKINHDGEYFQVEGPHLTTPSPQRTPLLFQAGASTKGKDFGARNAEAIFIVTPNPETAKSLIEEINSLAVEAGRAKGDLLFYQALSFVIGDTEEEAKEKEKTLEKNMDLKMMIAHMGGGMGIDFGDWDLDTPLEDIQTEGVRSLVDWASQSTPGRKPTLADLAALQGKTTRIVGTPVQIADELEKWIDAGVTGINVFNSVIPGTYTEFIEKVMPVLRSRGIVTENEKEPQTLRKKLFGTDRLSERHPAAKYRNYFGSKQPVN